MAVARAHRRRAAATSGVTKLPWKDTVHRVRPFLDYWSALAPVDLLHDAGALIQALCIGIVGEASSDLPDIIFGSSPGLGAQSAERMNSDLQAHGAWALPRRLRTPPTPDVQGRRSRCPEGSHRETRPSACPRPVCCGWTDAPNSVPGSDIRSRFIGQQAVEHLVMSHRLVRWAHRTGTI